ncbi:uncharacterized protein LOC142765373 [Rhipicephalus microplus]|uniref:uncharacterized protein LOC142765373 n=1 Tax=Rhipicephalus microplus TaxID=6941 RepID=UPI003F6D2ABB
MRGSPSHSSEKHTPPSPEPAAEAAVPEPAAVPPAGHEPSAEDAAKQAAREAKKRRRRVSRTSKHKVKARRTSDQGDESSPTKLPQPTVGAHSEARAVQGSSSEHTHPGSSDEGRQSMIHAHREENSAPTEGVINRQGPDEETPRTTHGRSSRHRSKSRHEGHNSGANVASNSVKELQRGLRCPPHQFSEIVAVLHRDATLHETKKKAVDEDSSLKYCVVVSLFVLLCLYYAGFLTAYMLLSAQPQQRPMGRTVDPHYTQWVFSPSTSRQPASGNRHATTDVGGTTQESAEQPLKSVFPAL